MLESYVCIRGWLLARLTGVAGSVRSLARRRPMDGERGQTTAEYALVILAAAAVAIVLIAWAKSSGKLPAFFDKIIDSVTGNAQ